MSAILLQYFELRCSRQDVPYAMLQQADRINKITEQKKKFEALLVELATRWEVSPSSLDFLSTHPIVMLLMSFDRDKFRTELLKFIFLVLSIYVENLPAKIFSGTLLFYVAIIIPIVGKKPISTDGITASFSDSGVDVRSMINMAEIIFVIGSFTSIFVLWHELNFVILLLWTLLLWASWKFCFSIYSYRYFLRKVCDASVLPSSSTTHSNQQQFVTQNPPSTPTTQNQDSYCYISGEEDDHFPNDDLSSSSLRLDLIDLKDNYSFDEVKTLLYQSMKEKPTKYCFIQCLEIVDQVLFVNEFVTLAMSRYSSDYSNMIDSLLSGSISIEDFKSIMAIISSRLHCRYRVFRKAYYGENAGSSTVSTRCAERYDCGMEIYGELTSFSKSFNLLIHRNHIMRFRGVRSCQFVNKEVGLGLWCDPQTISSQNNKISSDISHKKQTNF